MYYEYFSKIYTLDEYHQVNKTSCEKLIKKDI